MNHPYPTIFSEFPSDEEILIRKPKSSPSRGRLGKAESARLARARNIAIMEDMETQMKKMASPGALRGGGGGGGREGLKRAILKTPHLCQFQTGRLRPRPHECVTGAG